MKLWNTEIVVKWLKDNGFADCEDIVHNTRVTGNMLLNADLKLMQDTWGIQEEDRRRKLLWLIKQSTNGVIEEQGILHGWGANQHKALGPGQKLIKKPKPLPKLSLEAEEHIKKISCGNRRTLILTTQGRVLSLGFTDQFQDMTSLFSVNHTYAIHDLSQGFDELALIVHKEIEQRVSGRDKMRPGSQILKYLNSR